MIALKSINPGFYCLDGGRINKSGCSDLGFPPYKKYNK